MTIERRSYHADQIRAVPDGSRTFEALVVVYNVIDEYGTIFDPGCFTESLNERLPRITWAHSWSEPLGRYVDYRDTPEGLTLIGEFDDFEAVPRARQAYAQLVSGTIDQFSVGFHSIDRYEEDGVVHFRKVGLDEVALVLVGAVPGTKLLAVRSPGSNGVREVPEEYVIDLARKVTNGELTQAEAHVAIDLAAGAPDVGSGNASTPPPVEPDPTSIVEEGAADAALETLGLS